MTQSKTERDEYKLTDTECPIVYHPNYNITAFHIEKLHPFDTSKWGKIVQFLKDWTLISDDSIVTPSIPSEAELLKIHDSRYLKSLRNPIKLAQIIEVPFAVCIPPCILECRLLKPLRLQTGGTVLAANLALKYQWAINIGGGFHHAHKSDGGGFCVYADITMAIRDLFEKNLIRNAIIVDLDAHQGNGHERDFSSDDRVFIFDIFNPTVFPRDREARQYINKAIHVDKNTTDHTYLSTLQKNLSKCLVDKQFDFCMFNAGTDCLLGDGLGGLNLSPQCIIKRDETVFEKMKSNNIPICFVTSGGYQMNNALLIARSIENLNAKHLIALK